MSVLRYFRRSKSDRDRLEEIESYVRIETDDNIARGMPPEQALAAARKKFGNITQVREEIYSMNSVAILDALSRHIRYAARALRHKPAFTAIAVLTLALGIGANTAIFSVVNGVLLKPLAYPHPDRLVGVWHSAPELSGTGPLDCSPSLYFTYRDHNQTFQDFGIGETGSSSVTGAGEPEQVRALFITYGTLQALDVPPVIGRWFSQADDSPGGSGPAPVILSYGYWQRRFGGDKSVLGRTMMVDARLRQIVGVMPAGFRFLDSEPELIEAQRLDPNRDFQNGFGYQGIARLKPGVTLEQANADLERLIPLWKTGWPWPPSQARQLQVLKIVPALRPLKQDVVGDTGKVLWVLMGTIGMVLLIACANVANLFLVRAQGRQQELAIRAALGASRSRIASEMLVESLLLGLLGGAAGLGLAYGGLRLLLAIAPANLPRLSQISLDLPTLGFALAASLASGLLFGLIPALKFAGTAGVMRGGSRTSSQSRERHRATNALVVIQVALAMVLLVGSGLMIRTFQALRSVHPGFSKPESLQVFRILLPSLPGQDQMQIARVENTILDRIAATPGVQSAAFSSTVPLDGRANWNPYFAEDKQYSPGQMPPARFFRFASPGFLHTTGTNLIAGRDFTWTDLYDFRPVAMVSENMARELWGSPAAAIGKRIRETAQDEPWREVVGVAQDVHNNGLQIPAPSLVYLPTLMKNHWNRPIFVPGQLVYTLRSDRAGTESFLADVRQAVWSVNPNLPVFQVSTMRDIYDKSLAATSFTLVMLAIAGAMALLLGIVGIYGVISYAVSQRRREIGIRLALGAQQSGLRQMFVRSGLLLTAVGVAVGLLAAAGLTRLMSSLLFGTSALDPVTYAAVPLVLAAAAMLASYLPARRASSVDPIEVLKAD
ncbi:MAG TPA: ABC transporter permease [Bryobacteraceae bacterium]|jgi:predicted permease